MAVCQVLDMPSAARACSGKCLRSLIAGSLQSVMLMLCGGKAHILYQHEGKVLPLPASACMGDWHSQIGQLVAQESAMKVASIILVGSANDLAWARNLLPENAARRIGAEIEYPLLPQWFDESDSRHLQQVASHLFH